jgi:hypothetical protein
VRFIHRNAWPVTRVAASVVWLVAWALTVTGTIPKDFASALPLVTMAVPTITITVLAGNEAPATEHFSLSVDPSTGELSLNRQRASAAA